MVEEKKMDVGDSAVDLMAVASPESQDGVGSKFKSKIKDDDFVSNCSKYNRFSCRYR